MDLLESQTINSRMTSIMTIGNMNRWCTKVDVSRLRSEKTGLGFTPCLVINPKANPKSNVPPMRKARRTLSVTLRRRSRMAAITITAIHRTNLIRINELKSAGWLGIIKSPFY